MVGHHDDGYGAAPPPPPPPPPPPSGQPDGPDLSSDLERMMGGVEAAVAEYHAGAISLQDLQQRCLEAGMMRSGGAVLIWSWADGKVYGYDGFRVTELQIPGP